MVIPGAPGRMRSWFGRSAGDPPMTVIDLRSHRYELLVAVLDALPELVFVLDRAGTYIEVLGAQDTGHSHDASSLAGRSIEEVLPAETAADFLARIAEALDRRQMVEFDYELDRKDVEGIPAEPGVPDRMFFEGRVVPLPEVDGRDDLVVWMAFNVTASRIALRELERHREELERLVRTDSLTGLLNHRSFFEEVNHELEWTRRTRDPAALILLDLDRFKRVNDAHGHAVGDAVLQALAELLRHRRRATDVVGRIGGEEFALVIRGADAARGQQLAERLRSDLEQLAVPTGAGDVRITASFGVSEILPGDDSPQQVYQRTDRAMYTAKRMGRNRVAVNLED